MPTILDSTATETVQREDTSSRALAQRPCNVVLLDDDDHSYEYVIEMLMSIFGYSVPQAFMMAREVDLTGRVIVFSGDLERAELERDRISAYGADPRILRCKGSMTAILERT